MDSFFTDQTAEKHLPEEPNGCVQEGDQLE